MIAIHQQKRIQILPIYCYFALIIDIYRKLCYLMHMRMGVILNKSDRLSVHTRKAGSQSNTVSWKTIVLVGVLVVVQLCRVGAGITSDHAMPAI